MSEWIPCSERLPEADGNYLCCFDSHIQVLQYADGWNCTRRVNGSIYRKHEMLDVRAWQPLPEMYRADDLEPDERDLNDYTLEDFKRMKFFGKDELFSSVIVVPMDDIHDSGFRCMKFILARDREIVGAVGGWSDVVHPNGIGNYGKYDNGYVQRVASRKIPYIGLSMDCLRRSRCVRIMLHGLYQCDDFIGSDFSFYKIGD